MKRVLLLLTLALFSLQPAFSQMEFVQDINLGLNASSPSNFVEFQGNEYFLATNSSGFRSIFSIDVNENITEVRANFSYVYQDLIVLNNNLYAIRRNTQPLTTQYPYLVRININGTDNLVLSGCPSPDRQAIEIYNPFVFNNEMYFDGTSCDGNVIRELHAFNGSSVRLVQEVNTSGDFAPFGFTRHDNELYFVANTPSTGYELYKTNGSTISLVRPFNTSSMTSYNGSLFFYIITSTTGGINDAELFKLNTSTNTLTSLITYLGSELTVFNNELFFSIRNPGSLTSQLAKLDANDIITSIPFFDNTETHNVGGFYTVLNDVLHFVGSTPNTGYELYKYEIGTTVKRIDDYNPGVGNSQPFYRGVFNDVLYFGANDGSGLGNELHKYTPEVVVMTTIADASFEQLLINLGLDSGSIDGEVPTANIETITTLDISSMNISSISGIEGFTALQEFTSIQNPLTTLDFSSNTNLIKVNVINNPITSVNVSQNTQLEELTVSTQTGTLNTINVSQNLNLTRLEVGANNLSALDVSNNSQLTYLNFGSNPITNINLNSNTLLESLGAYATSLTDLDLSSNPNLQTVNCYDGQLTSLDLKNGSNSNLGSINVSGNPNLLCIEVDNVINAQNNSSWIKDLSAIYSEDCSTLSTETDFIADLVAIYPNPVQDILNIDIANSLIDANVTIYDVTGKKVLEAILSANNKLDISHLKSDIYFAKIITKNTSVIKRIIKQ